jgi:quinol monooxygenase YgiN
MIIVIVRVCLKSEDDREAMLAALATATPPSLGEAGIMAYLSAPDAEDPLAIRTVEIYESEDAVLAHMSTDHVVTLASSISTIEGDISVKAYKANMVPFDLPALLASSTSGDERVSESRLSYTFE